MYNLLLPRSKKPEHVTDIDARIIILLYYKRVCFDRQMEIHLPNEWTSGLEI